MNPSLRRILFPVRSLLPALLLGLIFGALAPRADAATTNIYADFNGATAGFGTPANTSDTNLTWSSNSGGTSATTNFPSGSGYIMTFGASPGDSSLQGTFTVNLTTGDSFDVFALYSTGLNITLTGSGNFHGVTGNWYIAAGSTLTMASPHQAPGGFNYNKTSVTFNGGGTFNFGSAMGANDTASGNGFTENTAGTVNIYETNLAPGYTSTYNGSFTLDSGTLNFASAQSAGAFSGFTAANASAFLIKGGTIDNTYGSLLTLSLGGGTNTLGAINQGPVAFTFGGTSDLNLGSGPAILGGNCSITNNAHILTIGGTITNSSTGFGITKYGNGTLALLGTNNYSGTTIVNAGKLIVNTLPTKATNYIVSDGATLDVQVSGVGQQLALTNINFGTNTGCTLQIDTGAFGVPTVAPLTTSGTVSNFGTINLVLLGTALSAEATVPVFSGLHNQGMFTLVPNRLGGSLADDGTTVSINLGNPDTSIIWNGASSGTWDVNDGGNNIWKGNATSSTTDYQESSTTGNDSVQFTDADSSAGTRTVTVNTTVSPNGISVNNSSGNYLFQGSGKISGTGALTKSGTGTLTLSDTGGDNFEGGITMNGGTLNLQSANAGISGGLNIIAGSVLLDQSGSFAGPTTIPGGTTLQVGNNDANGILPSGPCADNSALVFDRSDTNLQVGAAISGPGTVVQNGTGTLTLAVNNSFTGGLTISNGTLVVTGGSGGNTPLGAGTVTLESGTTLIGGSGDTFGYAGAGHLNPTNIVIVGGTVTDLGNATYRITTPNLTFTGGTLTSAATNIGDANGNYSLNGGGTNCVITTTATTTTATISATTVSLQEPVTFNIAAGTVTGGPTPGVDMLVSSFLTNYSTSVEPLVKTGTGVLAFSDTNLYTGPTTISAGTLELMGAGSISNTSVINIATGATLDASQRSNQTLTLSTNQLLEGTGTLKGNLIASPVSTVEAGTSITNIGTLAVTGSVTLQGTNIMAINAGAVTYDQITSSSVAYGGTLTVSNVSGTLASGQSYHLFTGSPSGNFTATNLPALTAGLSWTWNPLTGTLSVGSGGTIIPNIPPHITSYSFSGTNLVINATNGVNGGTYYLLSSTNVAMPLDQWTAVATNVVSVSGGTAAFTFTGTNVVTPKTRAQFYLLSSTNN
jgi:fibronectin-binding autotransporter adhesin